MPPVPDPDIEMRGRRGGAVSQKVFFGPSASVWSKIKRGARPTGPLPWMPVPLYEHHSQTNMFFLPIIGVGAFVRKKACGNPAAVPILFLFGFAVVCLFVFSIEHFYMITVRSYRCSDP